MQIAPVMALACHKGEASTTTSNVEAGSQGKGSTPTGNKGNTSSNTGKQNAPNVNGNSNKVQNGGGSNSVGNVTNGTVTTTNNTLDAGAIQSALQALENVATTSIVANQQQLASSPADSMYAQWQAFADGNSGVPSSSTSTATNGAPTGTDTTTPPVAGNVITSGLSTKVIVIGLGALGLIWWLVKGRKKD